eukprot:jgi/Orpsp1_1/1192621/evm.model.d7180000094666.1
MGSVSSKNYIINYGENSAFKNVVKASNKLGVIKMNINSITLDTNKESLCVNSNNLEASVRTGGSCTSGNPYSCSSSGLCTSGTTAPTLT